VTGSGEYRVHKDADLPGRWVVEYRPVKDDGPWIYVGRSIDLPGTGLVMDAHKEAHP
jgi:hypothetical protein